MIPANEARTIPGSVWRENLSTILEIIETSIIAYAKRGIHALVIDLHILNKQKLEALIWFLRYKGYEVIPVQDSKYYKINWEKVMTIKSQDDLGYETRPMALTPVEQAIKNLGYRGESHDC